LLRSRNIPIKGIVFNGDKDEYSEDVIRKYSKVSYFANIPQQSDLNPQTISALGDHFSNWDL
jgi:dethiobiotin synthetase